MKFVHFTAPNGRVVSVVAEQVTGIRDAEAGAYASGTKTVIDLASGFQAVRETREQVEKALS